MHRVHDGLCQEDAQTTYRSVIETGFYIHIRLLCGIKGATMILDDQRYHTICHFRRQLDMAACTFRLSIVDDVRYTFLDGEVQCFDHILIYVMLTTDGEEETSHTTHLCHLVLHDDTPWGR